MEKSVQITLIIVLGILLSVVVFSNNLSNIFNGQTDTISVNGVSNVKAMPDLVSVYFNVETKAKTSENATKQNSDIVEKMTASLVEQGFDRKKIQTQSFS